MEQMEQLALDLPAAIDEPWRRCRRCQSLGYPGLYPQAFFRVTCNRKTGKTYWSKFCLGCVDEVDEDRLLKRSLAQRIRRHARNRDIPITVYRERYGLHTEAVVEWFKRKWASGVLDCGCKTAEMHHGWRDAEIDQRNATSEPFFPFEWQLFCSVHNNSKGRSLESHYNARQRGWQLFREARVNPTPTFAA